MDRIPVDGPSITGKEIQAVTDAVARCWYGSTEHYQAQFERAMAEYLGMNYALALPSCTSALHLGLAALKIGPGDEVIVPDVTWIATAAPISYLGATPVFVDIDPLDWCLSVEAFENAITSRTKAAIVVDLYGNLPNWAALRELAASRKIWLIENAAGAFGTELNGRKAGSFGDIGVFSFHNSKTITTGEGGMLVTNRHDLYERVAFLHDHGRPRGDRSCFSAEVAFKYKMSGLQAALGLAQLERADEIVARKQELFSWYLDELGSDPRLQLNPDLPGVINSYWMTTVLIDSRLNVPKHQLIDRLAANGVESRPFYYPLSALPAYAGSEEARRAKLSNHVAYRISPYGINLPSALNLTRQQVVYVCRVLLGVLDQVERRALPRAA